MTFHFDNRNAKFTVDDDDLTIYIETHDCYDYYYTNYGGKVTKTIDGECTVIEECYD